MSPGAVVREPADRARFAVLGALAIAAAAITAHATSHGIGTFGDSGAYLGMAENLRHGRGLTLPFDLPFDRFTPLQAFGFHHAVPSTHFPPGYPLALTLFSPPGVAVTTGARVLGCVLAAANVVLSARLTARLLPATRQWFQLATPVLLFGVAGRPIGFLLLHAELGSEALFIAVLQCALLLAFRYLEAPTTRRLVALTAAAAVAVLTRNVGLFLLFLLVPAIVLTRDRSRGARLRDAAGVATGAVAPWLAFLLYGRVLAGASGGSGLDQLVYHPLAGTFTDLVNVAGSWMVAPESTTAAHALALLALVAFLAVGSALLLRKPSAAPVRMRTLLLVAAVPVYVGFVLWSQTFVDAGIPSDDRLLAPMRPIVTALFVAGFAAVTARVPAVAARVALVVVVAAVVIPGWSDQHNLIRYASRTAPGYPELDRIRGVAPATLIESPNADVLTLVLHHAAVSTARPVIPVTDRTNQCFQRDLAENAALLNYYGGYAYFETNPLRIADAATAQELGPLVRLVPVSSSPAGAVFRVARVPGAPRPRTRPC